MKVFLTIELIALVIAIIGVNKELRDRTITGHSYDGWTTYYNYHPSVRAKARELLRISAIISIIGVLFLIWTF